MVGFEWMVDGVSFLSLKILQKLKILRLKLRFSYGSLTLPLKETPGLQFINRGCKFCWADFDFLLVGGLWVKMLSRNLYTGLFTLFETLWLFLFLATF